MSSPFNLFRKYQKTLLAVVCVVCMIVFTLEMGMNGAWLGGGGGGGSGDSAQSTAVTWKYGSLTENDLQNLRSSTNRFVGFLRSLEEQRAQAGGRSRAPLADYMAVGLGDEQLLETLVLSRRAQELGVVFGEDAVVEFLKGFSDDRLKNEGDVARAVADYQPREFTRQQLYHAVTTHLLAAQMRMLATSGLGVNDAMFPGGTNPTSPAAAWEYYQRFQRRVKAELYPISVAEHATKLTEEPSEAELQTYFDAHKERFPVPNSPVPGFRRRKFCNFEYAKLAFEPFLNAATKEVTEEAIKEHYEKNKHTYTKLELPADPAKEAMKPDDLKPTVTPEAEPKDAPPADPKPADAKPEPDAAKPADAKPDDAKEPAAPTEPAKPADPKPADADAPKVSLTGTRVQLVSTELALADEAKPAEEAKTEDKKPDEAKPADPAAKPTEEPKPVDPAAKPAEEAKPATEPKPDAPKPEDTKLAVPSAEPAPQIKTLEEAREQIVKELAKRPAQEKFIVAVKKVRDDMTRYYVHEYSPWHAKGDAGGERPKRPDVEALVKSFGGEFGVTGAVDEVTAGASPLGKRSRPLLDQSVLTPFAYIAFRDGVPSYKPFELGNMQTDPDVYVYWKIEEQAGYIPELKDVRNEVVQAWKASKALEPAKQEAEKLAEEVRKATTPLKTALGEDRGKRVLETAEFSWLIDFGGFGQARLFPLAGVDGVDDQFMKSIFALKYGEVGVAVNQPQNTVYVVRVSAESPTLEDLRKRFVDTGLNFGQNELARRDRNESTVKWYEELKAEYNVQWLRAPREERDFDS